MRLAQGGVEGLVRAGRSLQNDVGAGLRTQAANYLDADEGSAP